MLTWYFYERSPLITNGYNCWQVPSFKPLLSNFETNPFISLQITVPESNQPSDFLQKWKKVNFVCWLNTIFCLERPYQKPRPSSISMIRTLLRCMEWFIRGLLNVVVFVWAQKSYQVQVVQMSSLHQKLSINLWYCFEWPKSTSIFCIYICAWENSVQDECRNYLQSTKNAFVWPLRSKIWPILIAIQKSFCVDLWRWMKHGSITILRNHVKGQNSGLSLVNVRQSVRKRNNRQGKL